MGLDWYNVARDLRHLFTPQARPLPRDVMRENTGSGAAADWLTGWGGGVKRWQAGRGGSGRNRGRWKRRQRRGEGRGGSEMGRGEVGG
ncbi:hypothetical protein Pmani_002418 [Petrolisthes manimaculis]|uniref:Uncharacterized protein n=1 Tax=Petrolisthes manimaculis TaxID=1843537 RepID=A0AAE1UKE2_9EUCA|nr:hypothetical protein Pmani_002418 [Petrolisthes manimaculis]